MRFSSDCVLNTHALLFKEALLLIRNELSTLVIMHDLDLATSLALNPSFELLDGTKCFRLGSKKQSGPVARVVINEGDPVPVAFRSSDRQRSMEIHVDKIKWFISMMGGELGDMTMLLAIDARLTDGIWFSGRLDGHSSHHVTLEEFLNISMVEMAKATMP
jgi:hypothetical protein